MKKIFHALFIISFICFSASIHGMKRTLEIITTQENPIQEPLWLPAEIIAKIAGHCEPTEKNILMKVSKDFNACLQDRDLIVQTNPSTIFLQDKLKSMFTYTQSGQATYLSTVLNSLDNAKDINQHNNEGFAPLHIASKNTNEKIVELLIEHGAHVNDIDDEEQTALQIASYNGNTQITAFLINAGADVSYEDDNGETALDIASENGHSDIVKLLIPDAVKQKINFNYPLSLSSENGHAKVVQLLFTTDEVDVNYENNNEETPLSLAAKNGHIEVVKLLLNAKAHIN